MITIYAEKPDVARKIACALGPVVLDDGTKVAYKDIAKYEKALKAIQAKNGFIPINFKGDDCAVTHGYGHLCSLWEPKDYDEEYKNWNNMPVPFIPERYNLKVTSSSEKQFKIVSKLFNKSKYIINATDWDREGEVIFSYVYEMSKSKVPYKRAYYNSQNEEAFIESFNDLRPASEVKNLEQAGRCRGIADWLIGMNMTVAATMKSNTKGVMSIGRVQTPTLAMVVEREKAIKNFVSKEYFVVSGEFETPRGEKYEGEYAKKFETEEEAVKFIKSLDKKGKVISVEKKLEKKSAPSLFSLSLLQMEANSKFGLTADQTLEIVQKLYEAGVVTYPRTSSAFLPEDYKPQTTRALNALEKLPQYESMLKGRPRNYDNRYFNDKKVESHFAIVPTHVVTTKLTGKEADVYDLICRSLIMTIYPAAEIEKVKVITEDNGNQFTSSGSTIKSMGWMEVGGSPKENILPKINEKEDVSGEYKSTSKHTEPPKRYTDKTLIAAMMSADKDADEKDIMSLAELNIAGIGQESTRASIIETLVSRGYIERNKKSFYATDKGINLIDNLPVEDIKSASLTAKWETRLNNVSNGKENSSDFIRDIEGLTSNWCNIVKTEMKSVNASYSSSTGETLICPTCGQPLMKLNWGFGCSAYKSGCKFAISGTIAGKKINDKQVQMLLTKRVTSEIKGFVSKSGKKFNAKLKLNGENKIEFLFD